LKKRQPWKANQGRDVFGDNTSSKAFHFFPLLSTLDTELTLPPNGLRTDNPPSKPDELQLLEANLFVGQHVRVS
jgi:hypothetical protein